MQKVELLLWLRTNPSSFIIINIYLKLKNSKERKFDATFESSFDFERLFLNIVVN